MRKFGLALTLVSVAACEQAEAPIYAQNPDFTVASRWASFESAAPGLVDNGWLHTFRSQQLIDYVNEALRNNRDLRAAYARLLQSRAIARQAGADLLPQVGASVSAESADSDSISRTEQYEAELEIAWEADIWGRIRGQRAAAALDAVAQSALFEFTRLSIAAQVVDTWLVVQGNQLLLNVANSEIRARRSALNDIRERVSAQALLAVDEKWGAAELARAQARQAEALQNLKASVRALEVILGRYPSGTLPTHGSLPGLPPRVPVGLPSELLERRPDVVAADRLVAAAFYRKKAAKAARLPRVVLSTDLMGTSGSTATGVSGSFDGAFDPDNIVWTLAGNLIAPIFFGGRLNEEVKIQTARQREALAVFGATALNAFREVENALNNEKELRHRLAHLSEAETNLADAIDLEQQRYQEAEIDAARLDEVRIRYYNVLRDLTEARVALLRNRVQLHLALGGSFQRVKPEAEAVAEVMAQEDG